MLLPNTHEALLSGKIIKTTVIFSLPKCRPTKSFGA